MAKLALGTAQFGLDYGISNTVGRTAPDKVAEILRIAAEFGVDLLDTAPAYGTAEILLGRCDTGAFGVVSKLPAGTEAQAVADTVASSLTSIGRERFYGYIVHDPADLLGDGGDEVWRALAAAKAAGRAERIGASVSTPEEVEMLLDRYPLELVQLPLNPIDARWQAAGTLDALAAAGCEVHVRSVYLQGLLLMSATPNTLSPWAGQLQHWRGWCADTGQSPVAACLGHVLSLPQITSAVVGVTSPQELAQALAVRPNPTPVPETVRTTDPVLLNPARWPQ